MTDFNATRTVFIRDGKNWVKSGENGYIMTGDQVYKMLYADMKAKYLWKCTYITRITRLNNYDGTATIKVFYDNGVMVKYIVED